MGNAERFAISAVIRGLRKSNAIDNRALDFIADELEQAATLAAQYDPNAPAVIQSIADDVAQMHV